MSDSLSKIKDPVAEKNFGINWTDWLDGDTIATSEWDVPAGLTEFLPSTNTTATTTVFLAGGESGKEYDVPNTITTTGGLTDRRTLKIIVRPQ